MTSLVDFPIGDKVPDIVSVVVEIPLESVSKCVFRSMWAGDSIRCGHLILFDVGGDSVVMWAPFVVLP